MEWFLYLGIIIIILIILVWIYVDTEENRRIKRIRKTIDRLYQITNTICRSCNMSPIYEIKESFTDTYTDKITTLYNTKGTINLVIWDEVHNDIVDTQILIYSVLHEVAHILSPGKNHRDPFNSIESQLLEKATELGYYDPNFKLLTK